MTWTELTGSAQGTPPGARSEMGMTASGGNLYIFGGWDGNGECLDPEFEARQSCCLPCWHSVSSFPPHCSCALAPCVAIGVLTLLHLECPRLTLREGGGH
eukprot:1677546-Rhodomonas_salina.1